MKSKKVDALLMGKVKEDYQLMCRHSELADGVCIRCEKEFPQHTPTPWKSTRKVMTGRYYIEAIDETTVATILDPMNSKEVEANAAFIVRAVNCHGELLDLAKWVKDSFKADERPEYVDALIKKAEAK